MKLLCDGWSSDGVMSILILAEGKTYRYEYTVDTARIPGWRQRMAHQPGKVLDEIKRTATKVVRR